MNSGLFGKLVILSRFVLFVGLVNMTSLPAQAKDYVVLALGDSLTAGYGLEKGAGFSDQLQQSFNHNLQDREIKVINGGVSGDTTQGGLARLNWALADNPDLVIVELGANDGLRGLDPALSEANLDQILARLNDKNIKVLLAGMQAPPNMGEDYVRDFNAIYPRLARKHGVALYPFFLEGVAGMPELNQSDAIHPTKEGVAVIVARIMPYILKVMD